jgi:hypothetical protein
MEKKWLRSNPGPNFTVYQIGELLGNAHKRAATGEIAVNGFRGTRLFPCDNIFRPHDFPLASEDTNTAPVNHPALVKTRDQPSFSSNHFLPFTSAEALRSSYIIPVPSLNLQPNPRGGTAKKITSSPYKKILWQLRKRKSNRPLNPKPIGLRRMLFLVLQKDGREGFAGIQLHLTLHQIQTLT